MTIERRILRDALVGLCRREASLRQQAQSNARVGRCFSQVVNFGFSPVDESNLQAYVENAGDQFDCGAGGAFIFLPVPSTNAFVPLMNVLADFSVNPPYFSLQAAAFVVGAMTDPNLRGFGFRFETPHSTGSSPQDHDFFHAQPLKSIRRFHGEIDLPEPRPWLPTKWPSFALDCDDYLGLVPNMLIALYGHKEGRRIAYDVVRSDFEPWFVAMRTLPS